MSYETQRRMALSTETAVMIKKHQTAIWKILQRKTSNRSDSQHGSGT